jgi:hypothetical protein
MNLPMLVKDGAMFVYYKIKGEEGEYGEFRDYDVVDDFAAGPNESTELGTGMDK